MKTKRRKRLNEKDPYLIQHRDGAGHSERQKDHASALVHRNKDLEKMQEYDFPEDSDIIEISDDFEDFEDFEDSEDFV